MAVDKAFVNQHSVIIPGFRTLVLSLHRATKRNVSAQRMLMPDTIISRCEAKGLRMTGQRRIIARVLQDSDDHPDVEALYTRASALDAGISIATVYRTVKLFEEAGILERLEFGDGRARYEDAEREHHDHLIDMNSGEVIEFVDPDIEALQEKIAQKLGYELKGHKLELYGVPIRKT
jgi:Fur family ferric uptake transcriptional regulator